MSEILTFSIPNPFFEGRNQVYLIRSDPVTLIDTGVATGKAFDALVAALAEQSLRLGDIQRVILTHKHIDHIGNAWRIQQASGAEVLIMESERGALEEVDPDGVRYKQLVRDRLNEWSVPDEDYPPSSESAKWSWEIEPCKATPLEAGQRLKQGESQLEVIHTPGHTLGSICLRFQDVLFSGDHVLPKISPNIGGGDMRRSGLLGHYLTSLEKVAKMDGQLSLVYPGHGEPFAELRARCEKLRQHHERRLDKLVRLVRQQPGQTVYQLARRLFGRLKDFHVVLGCAEGNAHLEFLVEEGQLRAEEGQFYPAGGGA